MDNQNMQEEEGALITESELNFIDLAGSEKVSNHSNETADNTDFNSTNIVKDRINEGKHINKSLFFLTQVISLKAEGKSAIHIPYRNSPLTKILKQKNQNNKINKIEMKNKLLKKNHSFIFKINKKKNFFFYSLYKFLLKIFKNKIYLNKFFKF